MRVIKHGNLDRYKETRITCTNEACGCIFTYLQNDIASGITFNSNANELVPFRYIRCPECFELILITDEAPTAASSVEE